jgi:hypothetical protein
MKSSTLDCLKISKARALIPCQEIPNRTIVLHGSEGCGVGGGWEGSFFGMSILSRSIEESLTDWTRGLFRTDFKSVESRSTSLSLVCMGKRSTRVRWLNNI